MEISRKYVGPHEKKGLSSSVFLNQNSEQMKKKKPLLASVFEQKFRPYEKKGLSSIVFLNQN